MGFRARWNVQRGGVSLLGCGIVHIHTYIHTCIWLRLTNNFSLCSSQTRIVHVHTAAGPCVWLSDQTSFFSPFSRHVFMYVYIYATSVGIGKAFWTKPGFDAPLSCSFFCACLVAFSNLTDFKSRSKLHHLLPLAWSFLSASHFNVDPTLSPLFYLPPTFALDF